MSSAFVPRTEQSRDRSGYSNWTQRVEDAARLYGTLGPNLPELFDAIAQGLRHVAADLPVIDFNDQGQHLPANFFAMSPEIEAIEAILLHLSVGDHIVEAGALRTYLNRLVTALRNLDACYPADSPKAREAERRLTEIVRSQSRHLAVTLDHLRRKLRTADIVRVLGPDEQVPASGRQSRRDVAVCKRSARLAGIEALTKELIEHIRAVQDHLHCLRQAKREIIMLPRPTKAQLAARIGQPDYFVSRCFNDPSAHELRLLWDVADNLELMEQYRPR